MSTLFNNDAVIDLEDSSTLGDDDVMVINESFEGHVNDNDIVIDDDAQEQDVIVEEGNSWDAANASIVLDDDDDI